MYSFKCVTSHQEIVKTILFSIWFSHLLLFSFFSFFSITRKVILWFQQICVYIFIFPGCGFSLHFQYKSFILLPNFYSFLSSMTCSHTKAAHLSRWHELKGNKTCILIIPACPLRPLTFRLSHAFSLCPYKFELISWAPQLLVMLIGKCVPERLASSSVKPQCWWCKDLAISLWASQSQSMYSPIVQLKLHTWRPQWCNSGGYGLGHAKRTYPFGCLHIVLAAVWRWGHRELTV